MSRATISNAQRSPTTEVAERAGPAVVGIGQGWGSGSGVVVAHGLVVTNAHNLHGPEVGLVLAGLGFVASADRSFRGPRGRRIGGTFEHTAPLPRGSSGGPVLDLGGRLVGINTKRLGEGFYAALDAASGDSLALDVVRGTEEVTVVVHWGPGQEVG